jgi:hypothetical protein
MEASIMPEGSKKEARRFFAAARGWIASFHWRAGRDVMRVIAASPKAHIRSPAEPLSKESRPRPNCQRTNRKNTSPSMSKWSDRHASTLANNGKRGGVFMEW